MLNHSQFKASTYQTLVSEIRDDHFDPHNTLNPDNLFLSCMTTSKLNTSSEIRGHTKHIID
jgi:hypothetical protein